MALVGVEHLGFRVPGQRAERAYRPHAADAEQQFLAEPVVAAAAVQTVGDLVQVGLVLLHVGVEQQQRDPPHLGHPDLRGQLPARAQADRHVHGGTAGVAQQLERQPVRVARRVALGLPAVGGQRLGEVPVPVQQPDPDQRHAEVARRLQVIPGQDAKAAGILRQRGGDAVLGREVGDRGRRRLTWSGRRVPARLGHVLAQVRVRRAQPVKELRVRRERGDPIRRQRAEHGDRVAGRACQAAGSIEEKSSAVGACQDQRRFSIRPSSGASGSGRATRTVNRRMAFTARPYLVHATRLTRIADNGSFARG